MAAVVADVVAADVIARIADRAPSARADAPLDEEAAVDAAKRTRSRAQPSAAARCRRRAPQPAPRAAIAAVAPSVRSARRAPRPGEQIGVTGERLTRDEAFDLVRRSVEALVTGDEAVRASAVRAKARELLGRDSESLSDRNFPRILKDAHDSDVIDLRRRGDDFEIARAAEAESVSEQLAKTAAANAPRAGRIAAPRLAAWVRVASAVRAVVADVPAHRRRICSASASSDPPRRCSIVADARAAAPAPPPQRLLHRPAAIAAARVGREVAVEARGEDAREAAPRRRPRQRQRAPAAKTSRRRRRAPREEGRARRSRGPRRRPRRPS